jgi:hypothetical protein
MRLPSRRFCLLKFHGNHIAGWVIADNVADIRERAPDTANLLSNPDITPGKHDLGDGYMLLVDIKD